jgi:hypothetical protein
MRNGYGLFYLMEWMTVELVGNISINELMRVNFSEGLN